MKIEISGSPDETARYHRTVTALLEHFDHIKVGSPWKNSYQGPDDTYSREVLTDALDRPMLPTQWSFTVHGDDEFILWFQLKYT